MNKYCSILQALIKAQRHQNIETFIVKPCKNISSEALQMMASSHLHIYKMNAEPPMGMSSLSDAICWSKRMSYTSHSI